MRRTKGSLCVYVTVNLCSYVYVCCVYVAMCMCMCMCVCTCLHVYVCRVFTSVWCMCVRMDIICMCIRMYGVLCVDVDVWMCMYVHMCEYIFMCIRLVDVY